MKKLSLIGFLLVLPTFAVTFFWLTSGCNFVWVEGMRCAPAYVANMIVFASSVFVAIVLDDEDVTYWNNSWRNHRAPEESSKGYEIQQFKGWDS